MTPTRTRLHAKQYKGEIVVHVQAFDGTFGDLVAILAANPNLRYIPSSAKSNPSSTSGSSWGAGGPSISAGSRKVLRLADPKEAK